MYEQATDIIEHAAEVHRMMVDYCERMSESEQDERLHMLLDYLAHHEQEVVDQLEKYREVAWSGISNTWLGYEDLAKSTEALEEALSSATPPATVEQVVALAVDCSDRLIELYQHAAEYVDLPEIREAFESLAQLEQHDKLKVVRNVQHLSDL